MAAPWMMRAVIEITTSILLVKFISKLRKSRQPSRLVIEPMRRAHFLPILGMQYPTRGVNEMVAIGYAAKI